MAIPRYSLMSLLNGRLFHCVIYSNGGRQSFLLPGGRNLRYYSYDNPLLYGPIIFNTRMGAWDYLERNLIGQKEIFISSRTLEEDMEKFFFYSDPHFIGLPKSCIEIVELDSDILNFENRLVYKYLEDIQHPYSTNEIQSRILSEKHPK